MEPGIVDIDCETLWAKLEHGEPIVVVDALPPLAYAARHLPGAINIPPARVDDLAERRIPDHDSVVVVYCADRGCDASAEVAARLVELGYRNVRHYSGGKKAWQEAGLPFEGARVG